MTDLDLDAIRRIYNHPGGSAIVFVLCDEVERLRVARTALYSKVLALRDEIERLREENIALRHQRDSITDYLDSIMPTRDYEDLMQRDIPNNPHR